MAQARRGTVESVPQRFTAWTVPTSSAGAGDGAQQGWGRQQWLLILPLLCKGGMKGALGWAEPAVPHGPKEESS